MTEFEILSDVIAPAGAELPPDVARSILEWRFSAKSIRKMNRLAARNRAGEFTEREREELERFLRVGSLINLAQAKARHSLSTLETV
ncbi:MAG: hypothetical protein ACKV0T_08120 [Planctomycetales bacterium]